MEVCEAHGRRRCGECAYVEELESQIKELHKVIAWLEKEFEEQWTYESGTGEVIEEVINKLKSIIN